MRAAALAAFACLLVGEVRAAEVFAGRPCMGTVLEVTVEAGDEARGRALLEAAFAEAARLDGVLSNWRPGTELSRFNARAGTGPMPLSRDLAAVLGLSSQLFADTLGTFDVTLGPVILADRAVRGPAERHRALGLVGGEGLRVRGRAGELARRGMAVDLGGIGKGYAVDRMRAVLVAGGARSGFLDFGQSSQLAFGARARAVHVRSLSGRPPVTIELRDEALSTSDAGMDESSVLDPRSGSRVRERRQATVVARSGALAEGWTKPLVILGRDALKEPFVKRIPGRIVYEDQVGRESLPR